MQLMYAFFKGKSLLSKLIKFWTRSEYSHVAFLLDDDTLIECWGNSVFNVKWQIVSPPFKNHIKGTPIEIWSLNVSKQEYEFIKNFMLCLGLSSFPYDYTGVLSFVLKVEKHNRCGFFCSEGCVYPIAKYRKWKTIKPYHINPVMFLNILEALEAKKEKTFIL